MFCVNELVAAIGMLMRRIRRINRKH